MCFLDVLLDTTWSSYFVPADGFQPATLNLFLKICEAPKAEVAEDLLHLSQECRDYLLSQDSPVTGDLNTEGEKRGSLQECVISLLEPHAPAANIGTAPSRSPGLLIEIRFQKAVARVVIFRSPSTTDLGSDGGICRPSLVLFKAPASYLKQIMGWLGLKFGISPAIPLRLPSERIVKTCSRYLEDLSYTWTFVSTENDSNAPELVTLKQVIGNLKLTISVSNTARMETAGELRTIDLEIPCESVHRILKKTRRSSVTGEATSVAPFLEELREAIRLRTGLKLPLIAECPVQAGQEEDNAVVEPPLRVTRVSCAAFAIGTDGRLKFAKQPVENAESVGYDEDLVRNANWALLEVVRSEAERQAKDQAETG